MSLLQYSASAGPTAMQGAARVAACDTISAAELFRAHGAFVSRFLWQLGVAEHEIEDAVQDVFFVAHTRGGYRPGAAKPTTWLAEIAVRVGRNRRRKSRLRREISDPEALGGIPSAEPDPADRAETAQRLARVLRALDGLDADRRAVFVLAELHGVSCADIAEGLNLPIGTVYSRLGRARKRFRKSYEKLCREQERSPSHPNPAASGKGKVRA